MYIKLKDYLQRDMDYPIESSLRFVRGKGPDYHLDFRRLNELYLIPNLRFNDEGVPRFDYGVVPCPNDRNGLLYSITYICWYALGRLQDYIESGSVAAKDDFLRQADWLLANLTEEAGYVSWQISFPWNVYGAWLPVPRVSSMDQGLAISVLVRAYLLTSRDEYLKAAKKAEGFYDVALQKGGFKSYFSDGSLFYEMYPSKKLSLILDGHVFSLMGLYDLYSVTSDKKTRSRFDEGLNTVIGHIGYWNYRCLWSWFGRFYLSSPMYHKINVCWMCILSEISGDSKLKALSDKWSRPYADRLTGAYLKCRILLSSRVFFLTGGRWDSRGRGTVI